MTKCYKVGDIVVIKEWDTMVSEYGKDYDGDINTSPCFSLSMRRFCGRKAKISRLDNDEYFDLVPIRNVDDTITADSVSACVIGYTFSAQMFESDAEGDTKGKEEIPISDEFNKKFAGLETKPLSTEACNKLVREMDDLLAEYDYHQTDEGLKEIVGEWYKNKAKLIALLSSHPNYNKNYQIVFDSEYHRVTDKAVVKEVLDWFTTTTTSLYYDCEDIEDKRKWDHIYQISHYLLRNIMELHQTITAEQAEKINGFYGAAHAREGQKLSKVIGKIARESGLDKVEGYTTEYPRLGDAINPLTFKRKTVISVNPIDYYTMSFGDTWQSCHTIDKTNKRRNSGTGYQGCYSSGTESYMLDGVSIVFYTIDESLEQNKGKPLELCDKNQRCMFHLGEDKLIQGRVYPQGTDGASEVYKEIRTVMQKVISDCFSVPNYWENRKGAGECNDVISAEGTNYRDFFHFEDCNVSYLKNDFRPNRRYITVGHSPICPCCGEYHSEEETIECEDCWDQRVACAECGERHDREDMHEIDGRWYCEDCTFYCEYHEQREVGGSVYVYDYGRVCEEALEEEDFFFCEWCGSYYYKANTEDRVETVDGSIFCCPSCAKKEGYREVEGEWYPDCDVLYCPECEKYVLAEDWNEEHDCCEHCAKVLEEKTA